MFGISAASLGLESGGLVCSGPVVSCSTITLVTRTRCSMGVPYVGYVCSSVLAKLQLV